MPRDCKCSTRKFENCKAHCLTFTFSAESNATFCATVRSISMMRFWRSSILWWRRCIPTFNLGEAEMTKRVIRAISNPFVTMLAHPTGRLLLKREGYAIDIPSGARSCGRDRHLDRAQRCSETARSRLALVAAGEEKGVRCVINPDAHRTARLQDLWFGIGAARKGWLTKEDVVNCLPVDEDREGIKTKARANVGLTFFPLRQKHGQTFASAAGLA